MVKTTIKKVVGIGYGWIWNVFDWVDERFEISNTVEDQLNKPVLEHSTNPVYCLGGIATLCFLILAATGIILALYYQPTPEAAYDSIVFISQDVFLGELMRSVHHWAANFMIAAVILHTFRVYFTGSYKKPRELNWVLGASLLMLTIVFGFSGYLLPWDQKAYWATSIGQNIATLTPVIGDLISDLVFGGSTIGAATLTRFYVLHIVLLPLMVSGLMAAHFLMVKMQGISRQL